MEKEGVEPSSGAVPFRAFPTVYTTSSPKLARCFSREDNGQTSYGRSSALPVPRQGAPD